MNKLCCLLPLLLVIACAKRHGDADARPESTEPSRPGKATAGVPAETSGTPVFDAPLQPTPLPVTVVEPADSAVLELTRVAEDTPPSREPELAEPSRGLAEFLTSMCGVRLPSSASALNLDMDIRTGQHTVPLLTQPAPGVGEFAQDIVVSVSSKAIFVNDYKVADIVCTLEDDAPCPDSFQVTEATRRYSVLENGLSPPVEDRLIIVPLLKQLNYFQKGRTALLKNLSGDGATWTMDCDVYTLAVDGEVPYHILASVIHTAGFADLTQARLVVLDDNDSLSYIPLLSPRLNRAQTYKHHIVGDNWWKSRDGEDGFAIAYLAYSASFVPDDFKGFTDPRLPYCLPGDIAWDRVSEDPGYARVASNQLDEYAASIRETHPAILGIAGEIDIAVEPVDKQGADETPTGTPGQAGHSAPTDGSQAAVPDAALPSRLPASTEDGAEKAGPGRLMASLFVTADKHILVFKSEDDRVVEAVDLPRNDLLKLYFHLARAHDRAINLSASWDLPLETLVSSMDAVRYRCAVYAMSGKCKRWDPVFPTVYLFLTRTGDFRPAAVPVKAVPKPQALEETDPPPEPSPTAPEA